MKLRLQVSCVLAFSFGQRLLYLVANLFTEVGDSFSDSLVRVSGRKTWVVSVE